MTESDTFYILNSKIRILFCQESAKSYRAKSSSPAFSIASMNSEQTWPDEVFESRGIHNDIFFLP